MKTVIALLTALFFLTACADKSREITESYKLPPELSDCKMFRLDSWKGQDITVVRCPNSTVLAVVSTKQPFATITVEGGVIKE